MTTLIFILKRHIKPFT